MKEFEYQGGGKVNGAVLKAYLSAFGPYQKRGEQVLCKQFGVDEIIGAPDAWYPLPEFFKALAEFQKQFGQEFMRKVGQGIFANAVFPPGIDSLEKAMAMINEAYYMNHQIEPGAIGGYQWKQDGPGKGTMVCDNPYPCHFDFGILEVIAKTFNPKAKVTHVEGGACRHKDGDSCTYLVEWEG
jgi:hypothetical protein